MDTTDPKPWYASKGVIGPLISAIAIILGFFNIEVDAATQALIVDQAVAAIAGGIALIGAIVGIWGRVVAKKPVSL